MTKEEIEKEANCINKTCVVLKDKEDCVAQMLELEKENTELKYQLTHRNCVDCSNHSSKLRMRNSELEKENAELEEQIEKMRNRH